MPAITRAYGQGPSVALVWHGFYILLAKSLAQREDVAGDIGFLDEAVGPYPGHQFFFGDHLTAALDKHQQNIKGLGSKRNYLALAGQEALAGVDAERAEFVDVLCLLTHSG